MDVGADDLVLWISYAINLWLSKVVLGLLGNVYIPPRGTANATEALKFANYNCELGALAQALMFVRLTKINLKHQIEYDRTVRPTCTNRVGLPRVDPLDMWGRPTSRRPPRYVR